MRVSPRCQRAPELRLRRARRAARRAAAPCPAVAIPRVRQACRARARGGGLGRGATAAPAGAHGGFRDRRSRPDCGWERAGRGARRMRLRGGGLFVRTRATVVGHGRGGRRPLAPCPRPRSRGSRARTRAARWRLSSWATLRVIPAVRGRGDDRRGRLLALGRRRRPTRARLGRRRLLRRGRRHSRASRCGAWRGGGREGPPESRPGHASAGAEPRFASGAERTRGGVLSRPSTR